MTAKSYTLGFLLMLGSLLTLTAAFNRIVDPFWYYADINIPGFNAARVRFNSYERHIKPVVINQRQPKAMIFGSSYAEIGFDPLHPALTAEGTEVAYNYAFAGAEWDRVYCSVLYALSHTPLRRAVIGIHPGPHPPVDCRDQSPDERAISPAVLLLSQTALEASWKTVTRQSKGHLYTPEGRYLYILSKIGKIESIYQQDVFRTLTLHPGRDCPADMGDALAASRDIRPRLRPGNPPGSVQGLELLLQKLADRGVDVKLVVYPLHAQRAELDIACGDPALRWRWLREIAALVDGIRPAAGGRLQLWDFQGTSDYLVERIRNNQTRNWQDAAHFNVDMGNEMLSVMFGSDAAGPQLGNDRFGIRLNPENIQARMDEFFENRSRFIAANPWFHKGLVQILSRRPKPAAQ